MKREIRLIFFLALAFTVLGFISVLLLSGSVNAFLFLAGGGIMLLHFVAITGIAGKLTGGKGGRGALYILAFMITIGAVVLITFYLLKLGKLMVIYFLSGTLTLALAANVVMIKVLLGGDKDARREFMDS